MTYSHKSPMHKLLASAGAVSIVAASFAAVPASFAAENPPAAAAENNGPCRHVAATATSYQGLPVNISWRIRTATCTPHSLMAAPRF